MKQDDLCETLNTASASVTSRVLQMQQNRSPFPRLDFDGEYAGFPRSTCVLAALFYQHQRGIPIESQTLQRLEVASWHAKEGAFTGRFAARLIVTDMAIQRLAHLRLQSINGHQPVLSRVMANDPDFLFVTNLGQFTSLSYATSPGMLGKIAAGSYRNLPDKMEKEIHALLKSCKSPLAFPLEARLQDYLKATHDWIENGNDGVVMLLAPRHT